jgi:hypothetical protein
MTVSPENNRRQAARDAHAWMNAGTITALSGRLNSAVIFHPRWNTWVRTMRVALALPMNCFNASTENTWLRSFILRTVGNCKE